MESYIVRIYRRETVEEVLIGTVEPMDGERKSPFRNFEELKELLCKEEAISGGIKDES